MRIVVVGTGRVGLVVGAGFAESGHQVTCVDRDGARIELLRQGKLPVYEPGLEELVLRNLEEERLRFTTDLTGAVAECLLVLLCVGAPPGGQGAREDDTCTPEVTQVLDAAEEVGRALTGYRIIVIKSTCPVGTAERVRDLLVGLTEHPFDVVANPEFLKEGAAVDDFLRPDRVIVGCEDVRVIEMLRELYGPFLRTGKPFLPMSLRSAELAKFAVDTMLAARISLMNEFANIAEAYGADIKDVQRAVMADTRIGSTYLFPGLGFGGEWLPRVAVTAAAMARARALPCGILEGIVETNDMQQAGFVRRVVDFFGDAVAEKRIAVWGASYKPKTDDIRNAPALRVIDGLLDAGATVAVFDPVAGANIRAHYGDKVVVAARMYDAVEGADALAIATEWREFHYPDFERMARVMRERVIFDGRNLYEPQTMAKHGFRYFSIGRPAV